MLLFDKWLRRRENTTFSNILLRYGSKEIGLKFEGVRESPLLWIGIILANFNDCGNTPWLMEWLIKLHTYEQIKSRFEIIKFIGIEFLFCFVCFKFSNKFDISVGVQGSKFVSVETISFSIWYTKTGQWLQPEYLNSAGL